MKTLTLEDQMRESALSLLHDEKDNIIEEYVDDKILAMDSFLKNQRRSSYDSSYPNIDLIEDLLGLVDEHYLDFIRNSLSEEFDSLIDSIIQEEK